MRKALIFGVTGQDGSYLAELLLQKGWEVHGVSRRTSFDNTARIKRASLAKTFYLHIGDITDFSSVLDLVGREKYDHIYNLAAQSQVGTSFEQPNATWDVTAQGCFNILEVLRKTNFAGKFYQASSSEMFGDQYDMKQVFEHGQIRIWENPEYTDMYQDENTRFNPQSPYAIAKLAAHNMCSLYRKAYGLDIRCGILFNHTSPRRGDYFVEKKIANWIKNYYQWRTDHQEYPVHFDKDRIYIEQVNAIGVEIGTGKVIYSPPFIFSCPKLRLGNLESFRDWGHARDYCNAIYLIMEQEKPDDYVVGTGVTHTIREYVQAAFKQIGIDDWENYVVIDDKFKRPAEVPFLRAKPDKITDLGWKPDYDFNRIVKEMVNVNVETAT